MGRKSREHWEKRRRKAQQLEETLRRLADGDAEFWTSPHCPPDIEQTNLEDILAFESVGSGISLFEGLQEHGMDLPHPDTLDESQSAAKAEEVMNALWNLQIILVGHDGMRARKFYSTLWNETLWEGCYVKKRNPGAVTIIDVSHSLSRAEVRRVLDSFIKTNQIH